MGCFSKRFFEAVTDWCVNDEVDGCIDDEKGMIDTGQTQVPVSWHEMVWTLDDLIHKEELCAIEDNSRDVADEKHHDDTDEDSGQI